MSWILDVIPWWSWLLGAAGVAAATYQFWAPLWVFVPQSVRIVLAAIAAAVLAFLAGRNTGAKSALSRAKEVEAANAERIVEQANRARADADRRNVGDGLRSDDGWRRAD